MRISDWSSDVCSSDLVAAAVGGVGRGRNGGGIGGPHRRRRQRLRAKMRRGARIIGREAIEPAMVRAGERQERPLSQPEREIGARSEEHPSELQSLMRISYAVFCLKKKTKHTSHA